MAMTAVFGDFLTPAREQIIAIGAIRDDLPAEAIYGIIRQFARLLSTLTRYLSDLPAPALFDAAMAEPLSPEQQSILDARIALRRGTQSLRHTLRTLPETATGDAHPAVQHLSAAASYLTAGHDLLHTHFTTWPGSGTSYWAPVIACGPVTAALLGELADCTLRLAPVIARASAAGTMGSGVPPATCLALHTASHCAWVAGTAMQAAQRNHPQATDLRALLSAIPANMPPLRLAPDDSEQVNALCMGINITAERLRHATQRFARQAGWPPTATSASWRKNALAAAITCHASEYILHTLAERACQLDASTAISAQLCDAAAAMNKAWPSWRAIAHHWDTITTGAQPGAPTGPVTAELTDLLLRTGRLAYNNQQWTPARAQTSHPRSPADLAPTFGEIIAVVGAVHSSADAITCTAIADHQAVQTAADAGQLYVPTRLLPDDTDIPRRYTPVPQSYADDVLTSYGTAIETSTRITALLDDLATAVGSPTSVLVLARQAIAGSSQSRPQPSAHAPFMTDCRARSPHRLTHARRRSGT